MPGVYVASYNTHTMSFEFFLYGNMDHSSNTRYRGISLKKYEHWSDTGVCVCHTYQERFSNEEDSFGQPDITCSFEEESSEKIPVSRSVFPFILFSKS